MSFVVLFRTGGTENFRWKRTLANHCTNQSAEAEANRIRRMGYKVLVCTLEEYNEIGIPHTYNADEYYWLSFVSSEVEEV